MALSSSLFEGVGCLIYLHYPLAQASSIALIWYLEFIKLSNKWMLLASSNFLQVMRFSGDVILLIFLSHESTSTEELQQNEVIGQLIHDPKPTVNLYISWIHAKPRNLFYERIANLRSPLERILNIQWHLSGIPRSKACDFLGPRSPWRSWDLLHRCEARHLSWPLLGEENRNPTKLTAGTQSHEDYGRWFFLFQAVNVSGSSRSFFFFLGGVWNCSKILEGG